MKLRADSIRLDRMLTFYNLKNSVAPLVYETVRQQLMREGYSASYFNNPELVMGFDTILYSLQQAKEYDVNDLTSWKVKPVFTKDKELIPRIIDDELPN